MENVCILRMRVHGSGGGCKKVRGEDTLEWRCEDFEMGMSDEAFEVMCPECGGMMTIDPVTRSVIGHTAAPRKKTFEDFGDAAKALREADARRDSIFAQSVEAQKNKDDVMAKKFAEAVKKAKESPITERPFREFDLD
jgi:hypothetical protein